MSRILVCAAFAFSAVACSSSTDAPVNPATDSGVATDSGGDADGPLDPSANDPVPTDLPALMAHAASGDVAPDLSCAGKAMEFDTGAKKEREFHMIELGGMDSDRVGNVAVEIFSSNTLATADITATAPDDPDAAKKGVFKATTHAGFIAYRIAAKGELVAIHALDLDVATDGVVLPAVPTATRVALLTTLIAGAAFEPTPGAGRAVVRIIDCQNRPIAGAHVSIEVDGAVMKTSKTAGVRRNYFGDAELPGMDTYTSRSGVAAFLEVPPGAKKIRIVARGKLGADTIVIGTRTVPMVADGVATAKLAPWIAP